MKRTTPDDKTEKVGITLPISLVKQIEKVFIRRAVEHYIRGMGGK